MDNDNFLRIDSEFIDQIYFDCDNAKEEFSQELQKTLEKLNITTETSRKIAVDSFANTENSIPFVSELLIFNSDISIGENKLSNYYTALKLCRYNLNKKLEINNYNFQFEETLLDKSLKSELNNYARIDSLYFLGYANQVAGNYSKRDTYFSLIKNSKFDLSPSTISSFYRLIGELHLEFGETSKALEWLKEGLFIDPKLAVKKIIQKIVKQQNNL